jgi:hypothetical protein
MFARTTGLIFLVMVTHATRSLGWIPYDCSADELEAIESHRARWLAEVEAEGGIPNPYPTRSEEVVANLRHEFSSLGLEAADESKPRGAQDLLRRWADGDIRFDVIAVENWSPTRCSTDTDIRTLWLARAWAKSTGIELARAVMGRDGHLVSFSFGLEEGVPFSSSRKDFPSLDSATRIFRQLTNLQARNPQFVTAWGRGSRCPDMTPCVAARDGKGHVLLYRPDGSVLRFLELGPKIDSSNRATGLEAVGRVLTVGSRYLVEVEEVRSDE